MSASKYGDIMTTHTNVPMNRNVAYIRRVEVDSFMAGNTPQQHLNAEPHIKYFSCAKKNFFFLFSLFKEKITELISYLISEPSHLGFRFFFK
jgi:hypothetical protein